MSEKPTIGVVGLSHLGIVSSVGFASLGYKVFGVDSNEQVVQQLQNEQCEIPEPGLPELFQENRRLLFFTGDFSELQSCDVVCIAKDTPTNERDEVGLADLNTLIEKIIPHVKNGVEFVVMSQVPAGFTRELDAHIRRARRDLAFSLIYWAETIVVGDAVSRFLRPGRIILGSQYPSLSLTSRITKLLAAFSCPILYMKWESAELTKAAINFYLAISVTFSNILADICEAVGGDISEIIPALRLDKRIGPHAYLKPGLGLSGGHLERDVVMLTRLAANRGIGAKILYAIQEESAKRFNWLREKLEKEVLASASRPLIAIWGLSYKKNTDSTRNAPSIRVIKELGSLMRFRVYDPAVRWELGAGIEQVKEKYAALEGADCLLILSDWDEFAAADFSKVVRLMKQPLVIDGLGVLYDVKLPKEIRYVAMGKPF